MFYSWHHSRYWFNHLNIQYPTIAISQRANWFQNAINMKSFNLIEQAQPTKNFETGESGHFWYPMCTLVQLIAKLR